jgi:hypothetical protein
MGSGGGGSSGKIDYPEYLKTIHSAFLDSDGTDTLEFSLVDLLNDAYDTNPMEDASLSIYSGRAVIDTSGNESMTTVATSIAAVLSALNAFDVQAAYSSLLTQVASDVDAVILDDSVISAASASFATVLEPDTAAEKAKYDADAALLGISFTNTYTLGKSFIDARKTERVALYDADLRARMYLQRNDIINLTTRELLAKQMVKLQMTKEFYSFAVEGVKLKILNEREYAEQNMGYLNKKGVWRFEAMQNGFNAIAAIGGGTAIANSPKMSATQATVSGAFSGAAIGAQMGGGAYGTAIGAVVGGVAGYLGSR